MAQMAGVPCCPTVPRASGLHSESMGGEEDLQGRAQDGGHLQQRLRERVPSNVSSLSSLALDPSGKRFQLFDTCGTSGDGQQSE